MKHSPVKATLAVFFSVSLLGQTGLNPPPGPPRTREGLRLAERGRHGMVACADPVATQVGVELLKAGGNAVDAAVAIGFALAVTMPSAGNLGGGGMMLVYRADGRCEAVDYREMLPSAINSDDYARPEDRSVGVRSIGVPGTVAAFGTVHQRHGRKPWAEVLEPARRLASDGVRISRALESTLAGASKRLRDYPEASRLFLKRDGTSPTEGEVIVQSDLARSIKRLQERRWRDFYQGQLADQIVSDLRSLGSRVTLEDWASYEAKVLPPLRGSYRGLPVITMPAGSSGGVMLLEMLNILEQFQLKEDSAGSVETTHLLLEVMKQAAYDRRRWHGDRGLEPINPDVMITKEYAGQIAAQIRTGRPELISRGLEGPKPDQTTHFSVVDAEGNIVSNTYTLQGGLGSLIVPKGTGVLLSGAAAYFDAGSGNQNDVGPRKRALFSMSPTLLLRTDGRPWLTMGVAGSGRIPNVLMQMIVNVVDFKLGVRDAVDAPRLHQELTAEALAEAGALSSDTIQELRRRGHEITSRKSPLGDVHAILIDEQGWRYGWSDGRSGGRALGLGY